MMGATPRAKGNHIPAMENADWILAASPAVHFITEATGDYAVIYVSDAIHRQLGYTPQDFTEDPAFWFDHIHPDDRASANAAIVRLLEQGHVTNEHRFQHADGSYRWMRDEMALVPGTAEERQKIVGYCTDITMEKDREEESKRYRARLEVHERAQIAQLQNAQRLAKLGIWTRDIATDTFTWSDEIYEFYGLSKAERPELTSEEVMELIHPDDRAGTRRAVARALESKGPISYEFRILRPDGAERMLQAIMEAVFNEDGRPLRTQGVLQDVSDRRAMEKVLREKEIRLTEAQRIAHIGNWERDVKTDNSIYTASDEAYRILGYEPQGVNLTYEMFVQSIHPNDRARVQDEVSAGLENRGAFDCEFRIVRPNDQVRDVLSRGEAIVGEDGTASRLAGTLQDITERKQREDALRTSERRYNAVAEAIPDAIIVARLDGIVIEVNNGFSRISGYRREEVLGKTTLEIGLWPDEERRDIFIDDLEKIGSLADFEIDFVTKSGEVRRMLFSAAVEDFDSQRCIFGIGRDISARKQIEVALRDNQTRLAEAQALSNIGSWKWDFKTGAIVWSDELYRIFGYSPRAFEIDYDTILKSLHPDDVIRVKDKHAYFLKHHGSYDEEYRVVRPDGTVRFCHSRGEATVGAGGITTSMAGTVQDITERKRAEIELRYYESIASNSNDWLALLDKEFTYVAVNNVVLEAFDKPRDEIIGSNPAVIFGKEFFDTSIKPKALRCLAGEKVHYQQWYTYPTQGRRYMDVAYHPYIGEDNEIEGFVVTARDITERKRIEDELKDTSERLLALTARLQKARETERTAVARDIHDELGQSLTALKIDLSWLSARIPRHWKTVPARLETMTALVDSTIAFVRALSSSLRPSMLDELGLEAAIEWQSEGFAGRTGCNVKVNLPDETLNIDQHRDIVIFRIFQEALTNVAQHANAKRVEVSLKKLGSKLIMHVLDDGIGIEDRMKNDPGSLGLMGMRERARMLGGDVDVRPGNDGGTEVILSIPITGVPL